MVMSRLLLDTNAVISLLGGNHRLNEALAEAEWVGISIVTKLEYLSFPELAKEDMDLFSVFENRVEVVDLTNSQTDLLDAVARLKKQANVKLPDAIIAASALLHKARLLTADKQLLNAWPELTTPV